MFSHEVVFAALSLSEAEGVVPDNGSLPPRPFVGQMAAAHLTDKFESSR